MRRVVSLEEDQSLAERLPFGPGWPEFVLWDEIAARLIPTVERVFAAFHVVLLDTNEQIVAGGWGVPLRWDGTITDLPSGWDGALERAIAERERGGTPDTLCAMATEVVASHRGEGISAEVLGALRDRARTTGFSRLIAPARPTMKHLYPLTPIGQYAQWTKADGLPFDPWLRTHVRLGARILTTTDEAMRIAAPVEKWERAAGRTLPESGDYVIPEALCPVHIDRETDTGLYLEPAVWMLHANAAEPTVAPAGLSRAPLR